MKPRGPLMIEHRLMEKMMEITKQKISESRKFNKVEMPFIDAFVDFMTTYADRTHHGKEEDIYFRECAKKNMTNSESELLNELLQEHELSRKTVEAIAEAQEKYREGEEVLDVILDKLNALVALYRQHIDKEDHRFFPESEKYFSETEQTAMLEEFREFDEKIIHQKYRSVVARWKN